MSMGSSVGVIIIGIAVLVVVAALLAVLLRRGGKDDWGGPPPHQGSDRGPYGATATDYPTAPPPAITPSMSEGIEGPATPQPPQSPPSDAADGERPRRIDDTERFREQNRPDGGPTSA